MGLVDLGIDLVVVVDLDLVAPYSNNKLSHFGRHVDAAVDASCGLGHPASNGFDSGSSFHQASDHQEESRRRDCKYWSLDRVVDVEGRHISSVGAEESEFAEAGAAVALGKTNPAVEAVEVDCCSCSEVHHFRSVAKTSWA